MESLQWKTYWKNNNNKKNVFCTFAEKLIALAEEKVISQVQSETTDRLREYCHYLFSDECKFRALLSTQICKPD